MEVIKGIPVSPGVVIGRAFVLDDARERVPYQRVMDSQVEAQVDRLAAAIAATAEDLEEDRDSAAAKLGPEPAKIFEFHLGLLGDRTLMDPIRERIREENVTAAYAVAEAFRKLASRFRQMDSEVFHHKADDILDLDRRLLGHLLGQSRDRLDAIDEPVLVIAPELTPAQAASLDTSKVVAFATDTGGRTSHTSIVAAALSIPVVVGCKELSRLVSDGDEVIIDGTSGVVVMRPDEETREHYREDIERMATVRVALLEVAELESVTLDGTHVTLLGNIEFSHEVDTVIANGGEGVGLFRTEFLYLTSRAEPTEEDHYNAYRDTIERLAGRPLTIRTADLGADKYTQQRAEHPERNPFLGLRSIRYCLQHLPMFKTQLRAILRASTLGPLKVMFPLISTVMELRQARMILSDVMEECTEEGIEFDPDIPIGMMIEVPSAALMSSVFAREVAFFSVGDERSHPVHAGRRQRERAGRQPLHRRQPGGRAAHQVDHPRRQALRGGHQHLRRDRGRRHLHDAADRPGPPHAVARAGADSAHQARDPFRRRSDLRAARPPGRVPRFGACGPDHPAKLAQKGPPGGGWWLVRGLRRACRCGDIGTSCWIEGARKPTSDPVRVPHGPDRRRPGGVAERVGAAYTLARSAVDRCRSDPVPPGISIDPPRSIEIDRG